MRLVELFREWLRRRAAHAKCIARGYHHRRVPYLVHFDARNRYPGRCLDCGDVEVRPGGEWAAMEVTRDPDGRPTSFYHPDYLGDTP